MNLAEFSLNLSDLRLLNHFAGSDLQRREGRYFLCAWHFGADQLGNLFAEGCNAKVLCRIYPKNVAYAYTGRLNDGILFDNESAKRYLNGFKSSVDMRFNVYITDKLVSFKAESSSLELPWLDGKPAPTNKILPKNYTVGQDSKGFGITCAGDLQHFAKASKFLGLGSGDGLRMQMYCEDKMASYRYENDNASYLLVYTYMCDFTKKE